MATSSIAQAAPKSIAAKTIATVSQSFKAEGMVAAKSTIVVYENIVGQTADIKVRSLDFAGSDIWSKTIDSGLDEVATALAVDASGNIWLAGNSAITAQTESETVATAPLNPDGIEIETTKPQRTDMNNLTVWQLNPAGEIVSQSSIPTLALVDGISVSTSGISILASRESGHFLITLASGKFSNELKIGTTKSELNAIARSPEGTTYLFGASSETLGGKKLVGRVDGVLLKVAKTNSEFSVVRSSAPNAIRDWQSATNSLFVTGSVRSGKIVESALTKFNSSFKPIWTTRIPSTGSTLSSAGPNGSVYAILEPTSAIKGVSGLKIIKGQSAVMQFDSKGALIAAFSSTDLTSPLITTFTSASGLYLLTSNGKLLRIPAL